MGYLKPEDHQAPDLPRRPWDQPFNTLVCLALFAVVWGSGYPCPAGSQFNSSKGPNNSQFIEYGVQWGEWEQRNWMFCKEYNPSLSLR